jgi:hypothetical protein
MKTRHPSQGAVVRAEFSSPTRGESSSETAGPVPSGGRSGPPLPVTPLTPASAWDPATGTSAPGPEMSDWRFRAAAVVLLSGEVLVVGGNNSGAPVPPRGPVPVARPRHVASLTRTSCATNFVP